jgi:primosomal protein N''
MTMTKSEERKELRDLLDREFSFLEILRQLRGCAAAVPDRSESLARLAEEIQACHLQIFKQYFFPIDQTLNAMVKDPEKTREELSTAVAEDQSKVLRFIETLEHELQQRAEDEVRDVKERLQHVRQMLGLG